MSARFRIIVPIQAPSLAMPRSGLSPSVRARLSIAFARDTLAVLQYCGSVREVVVVSPDANVADVAAAAQASFIQSAPGTDLNTAVDEAHRRTRRDHDQMVAVLASDLPALCPEELEGVLSAAGRGNHTVHVTDLGRANVTLQAERASTFTACLAPDPVTRRAARGTPLSPLVPGLRSDVDTCAGLRVAAYLGVGPVTRRAMDDLAGAFVAGSDAL